jgi:tetratricopeptide (TPR) repeat protein
MRRAEGLDPLSLIIGADMADILLIARLYDESIQQSRKTIELDPGFAVAHYQLGQAFVQEHMYNEAISELQKAIGFSEEIEHSLPILLTPTPNQAGEAKR